MRTTDERLDEIDKQLTKIYTVLIGNGVPGLVENHTKLETRVEKNGDAIKRIMYGGGGIIIVVNVILNLDKIVGIFK